ncbi:DUF4248 domain-containing protein [Bacteroides xylanisolvens]|uniref:DUF4248 domain-containing protein n=1 Tax=Bacteroides xylanisolvens TaxID=371601 RepID=UPI003CCC6BD9
MIKSVFPSNETNRTFAEYLNILNNGYDWLLHGCHALSEVAVAYFPNYQYNCSAVKAFRRIIKEHAVLLNQLTEAGFTPHTTTLTPQQIAIIVRFWGTPALVYEMIKKNSYLAVPKMGKKI